MFAPAVLAPAPEVRRRMVAVMEAALGAVEPEAAVRRLLRREGETLHVGTERYDLRAIERIYVVGAGKAGAPMARAAEAVLGGRLTSGVVVVKHGHLAPLDRIELLEAAHPLPDAAGLAAGARLLDLAAQATARDLVLVLISGGGSALLEALPEPLTLADLQATTRALLASGATIGEVNTLRKHLSRVKGGQLARALSPASTITLVLSDVVGSPLDVIASGPTVPDASTWAESWAVVERYDLAAVLPPAVLAHLRAGLAGDRPDTPKPGDPLFDRGQVAIVGDNAVAAVAAADAARQQGWAAQLLTTFLEGEAQEVARVAVALGREMAAHSRPLAPPACLILGGETTVTLGDTAPGQGGRNQELALAAALALDGQPGITIAALATDGTDGPTDAAGAIVDGGTVARARAAGLDPTAHLAAHDALPLLAATNDLLRTGPTNTNVNDLLFILATG